MCQHPLSFFHHLLLCTLSAEKPAKEKRRKEKKNRKPARNRPQSQQSGHVVHSVLPNGARQKFPLFHYPNCSRAARTLQNLPLIMNSKIIVSFLVFCLCRESSSFLNGFPKDQCDEMDPTKIKIDESAIKASESDYNNTDGQTEDSLPTSIQLSDSLNLYRLSVSAPKYRRGRTLDSEYKILYFTLKQIYTRSKI